MNEMFPVVTTDSRRPDDPRSSFASSYEITVLVRHRRLIAMVAAAVVLLALIFCLLRPPNFAAQAKVLIDLQSLQPVSGGPGETGTLTTAMVDSQVEVLTSNDVALAVIRSLQLDKDEEFTKTSLLAEIMSAVRNILPHSGPPGDPTLSILHEFGRRLVVERIGLSNVITVTFHSEDPEKAAEIANAVATNYLDFQVKANTDALKKASTWLSNRLDELRQQVAAADQELQTARTDLSTRQQQIKVQELETKATSYRELYDTFVQRYMQWMATQSFPLVDSSVVSHATPPILRAPPRSILIMAGGLVAGLFLGVVAAFARDLTDTRIRTLADAAGALLVPCLGALPAARGDAARKRALGVVLLPGIDSGHSTQARTLEAVAMRIRKLAPEKSGAVAGVTSIGRGDGKTTAAVNLARFLRRTKRRVLLIDTASYNPTLSDTVGQRDGGGLLGCLAGRCTLKEAVVADTGSGLNVLATGRADSDDTLRSALIWSEQMTALLAEARAAFDYVIFDLPPAADSEDVQMAADYVDGFLFVLAADQTEMREVEQLADNESWLSQKLVGSVLNRFEGGRLR